VKISGRVIGRRKASTNLLFLDLESNGETVQVMVDNQNLVSLSEETDNMKHVAQQCHRGAIVGIEGHPGRTIAGEFTVIAE